MDKEKLNEYREKWRAKIKLLLDNSNLMNKDELRYTIGFDKHLKNYDELSRKQSKTLNDIYEKALSRT